MSAREPQALAPGAVPAGLELHERYPLAPLTTIGTGGRARWYALAQDEAALVALMPRLRGPWFVLGSGSNLLIADRDFPGVVIRLGKNFRRLRSEGGALRCGAAVKLSRLVERAIGAEMSGFEELSGIPGTVGGAATMNAGTHLRELGDLVHTLTVIDMQGRRRLFREQALQRGYRRSLSPVRGAITSLTFLRTGGGDSQAQAARSAELIGQRQAKHPWQERTFGSTFKNPPGEIAARLIDRAGLKGLQRGGARVSPKHANFIENFSSAGALDILELIRTIRQEVRERFGITLEPEVRLLGFSREELGELAPYAPQIDSNHSA